MEFLNPWLWPAALLAVAPLLVHLLSRSTMPTIELATFRFLAEGNVHQQRRTRWHEAWLAALRVLAVLLMIAVFARPILHGAHSLWNAGGPGRDVVVIVDASASMNAVSAGASSFDRARQTARAVIARLAEDDRVTLIRAAADATRVVHRAARDAADLAAKIDALATGPTRGNVFAALQRAEAALAADARAIVYLLTDVQSSGWKEVRELAGRGVLRDRRLVVVDCGSRENEGNRAVIGRPPRRARAVVGLPLVLRPEVWNASRRSPAECRLSVAIDGQETAAFALTLGPDEKQSRDVVVTPARPGIVRGRYEIDRDSFGDDDVFEFTLNVAPPVPVLVVRGRAEADAPRDETLFLRAALAANTKSDQASGDASVERPSFLVREVVEGGFTARMIGDSEVVVLANCGNLLPIHMEWLREFVAQGGGLIVLPGDRVKPETYNDALFPTPGPQGERLVHATLSPATGDPTAIATGAAFGRLHDVHPLMFAFQRPDEPHFGAVRVARRFGLALDPAAKSVQTLIAFADGSPALVEDQYGEGRVLLAAFPFDASWSNLPLQAEFPALVMRMVQYVQRWSHVEVSDGPTPETTVEIAAPRRWGRATGDVRDPAGETSWLAFQPQGSRWIAPYDRTAERGVYVARVHGGTTEQPQEGEAAFAINTDLDESDFRRASEEEIRDWLPETRVDLLDLAAATDASGDAFGSDRELTDGLVWLLVGVILLEFALATIGRVPAKTRAR